MRDEKQVVSDAEQLNGLSTQQHAAFLISVGEKREKGRDCDCIRNWWWWPSRLLSSIQISYLYTHTRKTHADTHTLTHTYIHAFTSIPAATQTLTCPVSWGCIIYQLLLCRGVRPPPNECPSYDTKQSDGEVQAVLELWGMRSTSLLPSLPSPLWPEVVAPDRTLSMG